MKRLVLVGGGHAHVEVLKQFALSPANVELTLVTRAPWLVYSAMVPGVIAGHYDLADPRRGDVRAITLVGGGAAGVELALAMAHRLRTELGPGAPHVRVITDAPAIVPEFPATARRRLRLELGRSRVGVHASSPVTDVTAETVTTGHGHTFASDAVFWTAGAAAQPWIAAAGFATDARGFLLVD